MSLPIKKSPAAAGIASAIPGRLVASTYRQLLRLVLRFDLDPAFRSLVCVSHASVYSGELECWRGMPRSKDASPIEQYMEDVLRFANLGSDFYIADPENGATCEVDWTVLKQLYPQERFCAPSENVDNDNNNNKFKKYPLAYLTRLHFRGGIELHQFKVEMKKLLEEAYLTEIKDYDTSTPYTSTATNNNNNNSKPSSSPSTAKLSNIASTHPSASQLGHAFHCVRWLRNLTQIIKPDHPLLTSRITRDDLFGEYNNNNNKDLALATNGQLEIIPCYRKDLRQRWKGNTGASAASNAIFATAQQQQAAAATVRKAAGFRDPASSTSASSVEKDANDSTSAATNVEEKVEAKQEAKEDASPSGENTPSTSSPEVKAKNKKSEATEKVLKKLKERQTTQRLKQEKENDEAATKPEEKWTPLFRFTSSSSTHQASNTNVNKNNDDETNSNTTTASTTSSNNTLSSDINETEAKSSNLIYIDKSGSKWVDVPQKVTGNSASAFFICAHPAMPGFFNGNILLMHQFDAEQGALGFTINRPLRNGDGIPVPLWAVFSQEMAAASSSSSSSTSGGGGGSGSNNDAASILHHLEDNRIFVGGPVSVAPPQLPSRGSKYGAGLIGGRGRGGYFGGGGGVQNSSPAGASGSGNQKEQAFLKVAHFLHRIPGIPYSRPVAPNIWWGGDEKAIAHKLATKQALSRDVMVMIGFAGWSAGQLDGEICSGSWIAAVTKSPTDDKIYEKMLRDMETTRPFASPRSSNEKENSNNNNSFEKDNNNQSGVSSSSSSDVSSSSSSSSSSMEEADASKLLTKFDSVSDFVFSGNLPVSKEERLFDFRKEPDPMPHQWREYIKRLGNPGLTRMSVLFPEGPWKNDK